MDAEHSENIVYGRNAVLELLQQKPDTIEKIYFQFNTSHPKLKEIIIGIKHCTSAHDCSWGHIDV